MEESQAKRLHRQIIDLLREQPGSYVSGRDICQRVGVSRTVLWKHIGLLRQQGHPITARPRLGYAWSAPGSPLARTRIIGSRALHFLKTTSTNDIARALAAEDAVEGTIIIADEQTAGRGRMGRHWHSPRGGLWLSVILRPPRERGGELGLLPLLAGTAVCEAVLQITGLGAVMKWPNDIMVEGNKVGGILSELRSADDGDSVILGIGINVNFDDEQLPGELLCRATTLRSLLQREVSLSRMLTAVLEHLDRSYIEFCSEGGSPTIAAWRGSNCTVGQQVTVNTAVATVAGTAIDIDDSGRLIIRRRDGSTTTVDAGDVIPIGAEHRPVAQS